jgi:hypothetical protein
MYYGCALYTPGGWEDRMRIIGFNRVELIVADHNIERAVRQLTMCWA